MNQEDLIKEAISSIVECDEKKAIQLAEFVISSGIDPILILNEGFSVGIRTVGDFFERGEKFLPQLIQSASIMQKTTKILNFAVQDNDPSRKVAKMLIATVEGDVHDIGKSIVISLLKTQGIELIDLGRDVPNARIIEAALDYDVHIIGTSALLSTTLMNQKTLEDQLRKRGVRERFKTIVGGAPVTQRFADKIGADAYAEDAPEAVTKVMDLINGK
ncbi:MAG: dimethylamine corrinoid protein 3 [Desulfitibacter sp. BRH_c19]|nr:MAG: dimethylamine corrinoid protein 3 [Desulfitibacter sp. BRH_c19]